jgi:hypothetical protein
MFDILKKILSDQSVKQIQSILVIDNPDGYELFGEYLIRKNNSGYTVEKYNTDLNEHFYNLKNAVIWTTLYYRNMIDKAKRIAALDSSLEGALTEIKIQTELSRKTKDLTFKSVYVAKLMEAKSKKVAILNEIQGYELSVKNWQYRMYRQLST